MAKEFSIPQKAREEADRVEAEEAAEPGEPTPPSEPAPPSEPEPPSEPAPQPTAGGLTPEQAAELEKAATRYFKAVDKVYGGETPPPCSTCNGIGFDLTGGQPLPELRQHERYETCPGCEGRTLVKTGALAGDAIELPCPDCGGRGYRDKLETVAPVVPMPAPERFAAGVAAAAPAWQGNTAIPTAP